MAVNLQNMIEDAEVVAITLTQSLMPVEGEGVPIFPATYPAPEKGQHRFDTPYTINETKDGTRVADIDSVQSQANRMEAAFAGPLRDLIPQHIIKAGHRQAAVCELPHRIADAAARGTDLADQIRTAMLEYAEGKPSALAALSPTSLVYGAWDSRDTHIKIPRAVRGEIRAFDVSVFTRSAQFSGTFNREDLGLTDAEWKKGADVGFAPTPSVNAHGGVMVHGEITHSASVMLSAFRRYSQADEGTLSPYLLGLALAGIVHAASDYALRSGCWLVPSAPAVWQTVSASGTRSVVALTATEILDQARTAAAAWSKAADVTLGEPVLHEFELARGKAMFKEKAKAGA